MHSAISYQKTIAFGLNIEDLFLGLDEINSI
jgi:hypothetical protein